MYDYLPNQVSGHSHSINDPGHSHSIGIQVQQPYWAQQQAHIEAQMRALQNAAYDQQAQMFLQEQLRGAQNVAVVKHRNPDERLLVLLTED